MMIMMKMTKNAESVAIELNPPQMLS